MTYCYAVTLGSKSVAEEAPSRLFTCVLKLPFLLQLSCKFCMFAIALVANSACDVVPKLFSDENVAIGGNLPPDDHAQIMALVSLTNWRFHELSLLSNIEGVELKDCKSSPHNLYRRV